MLAAMQAWAALADELYTAASAYRSVVSELTQTAWLGPSSRTMNTAAERHVHWLSATAAQAEETATQARMATAAYEAAFLATVPPAEVAANRSLLAALIATNFLGQNTPAIAATEALYAEMWAQDALAMYTYAGSSAAAVVLSPFSSPEQNINPGALAGQAAAVAGQAQNAISVVPQALSVLAAPAQGDDFGLLAALATLLLVAPGDFLGVIVLAPVDVLTGFAEVPGATFTTLSGIEDDETFSHYNGEQPWPGDGPAPLWAFPAPLTNPPAGLLSASTTAALGEANLVGTLSVPSSWPGLASAIRTVALSTQLAPTAAASQVGAAMAGQAMVGPPPSSVDQNEKPITHARLTRTPNAVPAVTASSAPRKVVTGVVAAIRAIARQRADGLLTDEEYDERKKDLLESASGVLVERATGIEPA